MSTISPDPKDTRDLARDAAINGGVDEETLVEARDRVRELKQNASSEEERERWDDAEQALLGAISRARRDD